MNAKASAKAKAKRFPVPTLAAAASVSAAWLGLWAGPVPSARADDLLGASSFVDAAADRIAFGEPPNASPNPPPTVTFAKGRPTSVRGPASFATVVRITGDFSMRLPASLPVSDRAPVEDVVWFRFEAENFGLLAGDLGGHTLLKFTRGGPTVTVRGHPTRADGKLLFSPDGTEVRDTGVAVRPDTPYRLRTILNPDPRGPTADIFLADLSKPGQPEVTLVAGQRFKPLDPSGLERVFEAAGKPRGVLEIGGWQLWDNTRRIERLRAVGEGPAGLMTLPALASGEDPRVSGDLSVSRGRRPEETAAVLAVRRGFEDSFYDTGAPGADGRSPAASWTGPGRVVTGIAGAEAGCLEASGSAGAGGKGSSLRRRMHLPRSDWTLSMRFRVPAGLASGRMIHLVEFQTSRGGDIDRAGPLVWMSVPAHEGPGRPYNVTMAGVEVAERPGEGRNREFRFNLPPDTWHTLVINARPGSGRYDLKLLGPDGKTAIADSGPRALGFVAGGADLVFASEAELVLAAEPLFDAPPPAAARPSPMTVAADKLLEKSPAMGWELRGLSAGDGRLIALARDPKNGNHQVVFFNPDGGVQKLRTPDFPGVGSGLCFDRWAKCFWVITPERDRLKPPKRREGRLPQPSITRLTAELSDADWPPEANARVRGRGNENHISFQPVVALTAGPEELYITGNGPVRCYDKVSGAFRRTLTLQGRVDLGDSVASMAHDGRFLYLLLKRGSRLGDGILVVDPVADGVVARLAADPATGNRPYLTAEEGRLFCLAADAAEGKVLSWKAPTEGDLGGNRPWLLVDRVSVKPPTLPAESEDNLIRRLEKPGPLPPDWRSPQGADLGHVGADTGQWASLKVSLVPPRKASLVLMEIPTARLADPAPRRFFIACLPAEAADAGKPSAEPDRPVRLRFDEFLRRAGTGYRRPGALEQLPADTEGLLLPATPTPPKNGPAPAGPARPTDLSLDLMRDLALTEGDVLRQVRLRRFGGEEWFFHRIALAADPRGGRTEFSGEARSPVMQLAAASSGTGPGTGPEGGAAGSRDAGAEFRLARVEWDASAGPKAGVVVEVRQASDRYELAGSSASPWKPVSIGEIPADKGAPVGRYFQWRVSLSNAEPYTPVRLSGLRFSFVPVTPAESAQSRGEPAADPSAAFSGPPARGGMMSVVRYAGLGVLALAGLAVGWWVFLRKPDRPSAA